MSYVNPFTSKILRCAKKINQKNKKRLSIKEVFDAMAGSYADNFKDKYHGYGNFASACFELKNNRTVTEKRELDMLHNYEQRNYVLNYMLSGMEHAFYWNHTKYNTVDNCNCIVIRFCPIWKGTHINFVFDISNYVNKYGSFDFDRMGTEEKNRLAEADVSEVYLKCILVQNYSNIKIEGITHRYDEEQDPAKIKSNFAKIVNKNYTPICPDKNCEYSTNLVEGIIKEYLDVIVTKDDKKNSERNKKKIRNKFSASAVVGKFNSIISEENLKLKIKDVSEVTKKRSCGEYFYLSVCGTWGYSRFPVRIEGDKPARGRQIPMLTNNFVKQNEDKVKQMFRDLNEYLNVGTPLIENSKFYRYGSKREIENN